MIGSETVPIYTLIQRVMREGAKYNNTAKTREEQVIKRGPSGL